MLKNIRKIQKYPAFSTVNLNVGHPIGDELALQEAGK